MIYLVTLSLLLVLAANYSISRNMLYPPCVYTAVWLVSLLGLIVAGDTYYPVATEALLVYLVGAVAFSVGGVVVLTGMPAAIPVRFGPARIAQTRGVLDLALLCVVIGFPFYMWNIMGSVDGLDIRLLAVLRQAEVEQSASSERAFSVLRNLMVLAQFVAMAMHYENDGTRVRRWRSYAAILLALVYGVLTGSKGFAVSLILSLMFISFMHRKRVAPATLIWAVLVMLSLFGVGVLLVNYIDMVTGLGAEAFRYLAETIPQYWLGGLVAFNRVVEAPQTLESVQHLNRFFLETGNALGGKFNIPSIHADYTTISPVQETNTYTIYFSYFHSYGWVGVLLGMPLLGAALTWIYSRALAGRVMAVFFYGAFTTGAVLSFHAEHFVLSLNSYIKMLIFFYLVYHVFGRLALPHQIPRRQGLDHA